jgi:hypothetical protein
MKLCKDNISCKFVSELISVILNIEISLISEPIRMITRDLAPENLKLMKLIHYAPSDS